MAFTPDQPYPKSPGNPIMSKDWNDAIGEVQRLDTAKVSRTGADTMQGPLTINGALAVGTTSAGNSRLHVVDTANPAVARIQSTATNAAARVELWSDPRGSGTEWRPGYIEAFDAPPAGSYTGGLRFYTNGTGIAARFGFQEQLRLVNGAAGFGVTDPAYRVDIGGQLRVRQGGTSAAGLFLHQNAPNNNRVFMGMLNDNSVGFQGLAGGGWGLQMDVTNGNIGIKTGPSATNALTVQGASQLNGDVYNSGNMAVGHSSPAFRLDVAGRIRLRDGGGMAGTWLFNSTSAAPQDRALVTLVDQNTYGVLSNLNGSSFLHLDLNSGRVLANRYSSSNVKLQATGTSFVSTTSGSYSQISPLTLTFNLAAPATCFFLLVLPGCNLEGVTGNWGTGVRLVLDGSQIAQQVTYFNNTAGVFETRHVVLSHIRTNMTAGSHTLTAEWYTQGGTLYTSNGSGDRTLQVIELA
jgi:hypothetical protein